MMLMIICKVCIANEWNDPWYFPNLPLPFETRDIFNLQ